MIEKKCGEYADLINKVASGNASESETEELLLHAETCPECFDALEKATRIGGTALAKLTLSPEIKDKIKRSAPKKSRKSRFVKVFGGVAAAAVITIAVFALIDGRGGLLHESYGQDAVRSGNASNEDLSYSINAPAERSKGLNDKEGSAEKPVTSSSFDSVDNAESENRGKQSTQVSEEKTEELHEVPLSPEVSELPIEIESEKLPFDVVKIAAKEKISLSRYRYIAVGAVFDASKEIKHKTAGIDCFIGSGACAQKGMKLYSNPYFESGHGSDGGSFPVLVLENK